MRVLHNGHKVGDVAMRRSLKGTQYWEWGSPLKNPPHAARGWASTLF